MRLGALHQRPGDEAPLLLKSNLQCITQPVLEHTHTPSAVEEKLIDVALEKRPATARAPIQGQCLHELGENLREGIQIAGHVTLVGAKIDHLGTPPDLAVRREQRTKLRKCRPGDG